MIKYAYKLACLKYVPSSITFKGKVYQRQELLDHREAIQMDQAKLNAQLQQMENLFNSTAESMKMLKLFSNRDAEIKSEEYGVETVQVVEENQSLTTS